jgi:hypothetical protein
VLPGAFALSTFVCAACWLGAAGRSLGAEAPPCPLVLKVVDEVCCERLPGVAPRLRFDTEVPVLFRVWWVVLTIWGTLGAL